MKKLIIALTLFFSLSTGTAYPYWIWTPKTGKWVNPKDAVKATPKAQLEYAKGLLDAKKYDEAEREFKKILKSYPKAVEAAESQFFLGQIKEKTGSPYEAYKAYQLVVEKYPFSERIGEINTREFAIADEFLTGSSKRKALGMALPVENPAIEIFGKIVDNAPYGPLAGKAQYKLGLVLKSLSRFNEAEEAFGKVLSNYPESEWAEPAKFQMAETRAAVCKNSDYPRSSSRSPPPRAPTSRR
jgi:TolA-binding protein